MKSGDPSSRSCSCTSCLCKSDSAQLKKMLLQDSRRGNINLDKYTPLLGRQFACMSVRTRAVINEIEYQFISKNKVADDSVPLLLDLPKLGVEDIERTEKRSATHINKGGVGQSFLSGCCSCCSCGCKKRQHVCRCCSYDSNQRRQDTSEQQSGAFRLDCGGIGSRVNQERIISRHTKCIVEPDENFVHHKTKHIQSDPCSYVLESMGLQKPAPEGSVQKRRTQQQLEHNDHNIETRSRKIRQAYRGMATGMGESVIPSATKIKETKRKTEVGSRNPIDNEKDIQDVMKKSGKSLVKKMRFKLNQDIMGMADLSLISGNDNNNLKNCYDNYEKTLQQDKLTCYACYSNECKSRENLEIRTQCLRKNRKGTQGVEFEKNKSRKYESSITGGTGNQTLEKVVLVDTRNLSIQKDSPEHRGRRRIYNDEREGESFANLEQLKIKEENKRAGKCTYACDIRKSPVVIMKKSSVSSTCSLRRKSLVTVPSSSGTVVKKHSQQKTKEHEHQQKPHLPSKKQVLPQFAEERQILKNLQRPAPESQRWQAIRGCSPLNLSIDMYENKLVPNMGRGDRRKVRRKYKAASTSQRSEKEVRSGGYDLKRCFCTLKLKSKTTKTRMNKAQLQKINKLVTKSLQGLKLKISPLTQHDALLRSDQMSCMREENVPIKCQVKSGERYCKLPNFLTNANYQNRSSKSCPDIKFKKASTCGSIKLIYNGPKLETKTHMDLHNISRLKEDSPNQPVSCSSTLNMYMDFSEGDFSNETKHSIETQVHPHNSSSKLKKKFKDKSRKHQNIRARETRINLANTLAPLICSKKSKHSFTLTRHNLRLCVCTLKLAKQEYKSGIFPKGTMTSSRSLPAVEVKSLIEDKATGKLCGHRSKGSLQLYECKSRISISDTCYQCKSQKVTKAINKPSAMQKTETQNEITVSSCANSARPRKITTKGAQSASIIRQRHICQTVSTLSTPNMEAIASNFSFGVGYRENKEKKSFGKEMLSDPEISKLLGLLKSKGESQIKQAIEEHESQSPFIKASGIQSMLKICTLKQLQEKNKTTTKSLAHKTRPVETIVMSAQLFHNNINLPKYVANKGTHKVSNKVPRSPAAHNLRKEMLLSGGAKSKILTSNCVLNKLQRNPFIKNYFYAMNFHVQHRGYKLEPYECEPGVCIPGQCNPYECQKRILKRLMRKASTMTSTDKRSMSVETGGYPYRSTRKQQYESKPTMLDEYHNQGSLPQKRRNGMQREGISDTSQGRDYETSSRSLRRGEQGQGAVSNQRAVRIGSSFSFNVSFSKEGSLSDKGFKRTANGIASNRRTPSVSSSRSVSRNSISSTTTMPRHTQHNTKGTGDRRYGRDSVAQSVTRMHHKGSITRPKNDRCFCTLKLQKKGRLQKNIGKQREKEGREWKGGEQGKKQKKKEIKSVNTGQNTSKKYNKIDRSGLAPYECEPNVCVPGQCDPYVCLERIKRRNKSTKDFGAGPYSRQSTGTGTTTKHMTRKSPDANTMTSYARRHGSQQSTSTNMIVNNRPMKNHYDRYAPQGRNAASSRRLGNGSKPAADENPSNKLVRIGSNFSFSIEFYKDKTPERPDVLNEHNKKPSDSRQNIARNSDTEVNTNFDVENKRKSVGTRNKEMGVDNYSSVEKIQTKNQKAGVVPRLKRCFCTLALHKEIYEGKKPKGVTSKNQINMATKGTNGVKAVKITPTHREAYNKARPYKLEPYECEPGVCIPGQCDPYQCAKLIKQRLLRESGTGTESFRGKTAFTETGKPIRQKNRKGQIISAVSAEQVQVCPPINQRQLHRGEPVYTSVSQENIGHDQRSKNFEMQNEVHDDRQVVRIGSNFSFNVEFYKIRSPVDKLRNYISSHRTPNGDVEDTNGRRRLISTTSGTKSYGTDSRRMESKSYGTDGRTMESKAHGTNNRKMESKRSGGGLLKRCFCTLTLQKGGKKLQKPLEKQNIQPEFRSKQKDKHVGTKKYQINNGTTVYKEVGTKTKKHQPSYNLEPYECEPGTCVPGHCNPSECYERIKRRELRMQGTGTKRNPRKTIRNMTDQMMIDENTHMENAYGKQEHGDAGTDSPADRAQDKYPDQSHHDNATGENAPNYPASNPNRGRVTRIGSNFNLNIEFYKNKSGADDDSRLQNQNRMSRNEPRGSKHYSSSFPDQHGGAKHDALKGSRRHSSRSQDRNEYTDTARGRAQHTNMKRNARNSEIQATQITENKGTVPGKALKRCFCTAKLFQADNTRQKMYTVGRVDRIRTLAPFNWLPYEHRCTKYQKKYLDTTAPFQISDKIKCNRKKSQLKGFEATKPVELTIVYLNKNTAKGKDRALAERARLCLVLGAAEKKCHKRRDSQWVNNTRENYNKGDLSNEVETIQLFVAKNNNKFKSKSIHKSYRQVK